MFSDSRKYIILKVVPNFSSGLPSPFSSIASKSSLSYQSHAGGINVAREDFSDLNFFLTSSVAYISVLNFPRINSPIFENPILFKILC